MNNAVKRELSVIAGLLAIGASAAGFTLWSRRLRYVASGLFLTSFIKSYSLRGKNAYITGGSRGLGLSIAWNLLERGAEAVTLVARDEAELKRGREILLKTFPDAQIFLSMCDITEPAQLQSSMTDAIEDM